MITVQYEAGLSFEDVEEFIPMLTIDNAVKSQDEIIHFELFFEDKSKTNLFFDEKTKEFVYDNAQNNELVYSIGEKIVSLHKKYADDLEFLTTKLLKEF